MKSILWSDDPAPVTLIAASGALKNLANGATALAAADVANGTDLKTHADFRLYLHDFAAAPSAGGYVECHILYKLGDKYADGEDGDLAGTPHLSGATLAGVFPVYAADEDQYLQLAGVRILPHDFRVALVNRAGAAIANSDGSTLAICTYHLQSA